MTAVADLAPAPPTRLRVRDDHQTLGAHLALWAGEDAARLAVAAAIVAMSEAGKKVATMLARGGLDGDPARIVGTNSDGDRQKALDVAAHGVFVEEALRAGAAWIGSEEAAAPIEGASNGRVAIAFDPIDGSSMIGIAGACGTLFSVLPVPAGSDAAGQVASLTEPFAQPGARQLAAGYLVYGPETVFGFTVGHGVQMMTLDRNDGVFKGTGLARKMPASTSEIGVDLSFRRHWTGRQARYVDDCLAGRDGPRGEDVRLRWMMAAVVDLHRILVQGGIFLYPADRRPGNANGRLRHVYEVNPMALLIEQAGGRATDGEGRRLLDLVPGHLHDRAPIVAGSRREVDRYESAG
ncbi:class 1 fructose-bisphosphatase [Methylobrevis pamukkalensis]|uniref:Fructose-1,6-bisphosphatase class 1 n=1 Tax=Methylobrevis pamukkalensis TaxID=1439726 RepID=A0A1E3H4T0_9HYPH|nr:class 1 fructose-bisphosphatase [Methylobrevis pamukkalensis]ODN71322.1 Fructose-1,6-bisphosphatase class 1 [Methylobrevis pamukkalensis]